MSHEHSHLSRFLRRVRVRLLVARVAECAGGCAAIGCGAALLLMPILMWRGQSAMPVAAAALAGGMLAGLIWGVIRRPTLFDAATEADRQLDLADLLGSALLLRGQVDDAWRGAVLATAEARCATLSPSSVIARRFGARAWGGIGLAGALVLTLGLLSTDVSNTMAGAGQDKPAATSAADPPRQAKDVDGQRVVGAPRLASSARPDTDPTRHDQTSDEGISDPSEARATASSDAGASSTDGAGGGAGESTPPRPPVSPNASRDGTRDTASATGDLPPGSDDGPAGADATGSRGTVASRTGGSAATRHAPPWSSPAWAADRDAALDSIRNGRVPDAYLDLVREYFERDTR